MRVRVRVRRRKRVRAGDREISNRTGKTPRHAPGVSLYVHYIAFLLCASISDFTERLENFQVYYITITLVPAMCYNLL